MAEKLSTEEKKFSIPDSPLEVKLSIQRDRPPALRVMIYGQKRDEHKDLRYANAVNHLLDELKAYVTISGRFPAHGRLTIDTRASDDLSLHIRYPSDPPPRYPISLVDMLIRDPISRASRAQKNRKSAEKLFEILSEKMPVFIGDLKIILQNDRFSSGRHSHGSHSKEIKIDKEKKEAYDVLGVTPGTPWEKIKRTYREKARKAHPDANRGVDDGSFQKLQNAYEMIKKWHQKSGK